MELRAPAEPEPFAASRKVETREPGVFIFNPFSEGRIAEGKPFNPTKPQAQLARDLENLPQFLCRPQDLVLVHRRPDDAFLRRLEAAGFPTPAFVELPAPKTLPAGFETRQFGFLRPWAWGPDSVELLAPLFDQVTGETRPAEQRFNPGLAQLYSKAWSADFLRQILAAAGGGDGPDADWLCPANSAGIAVSSPAEALEVIARIRARGHHKLIVKEALGAMGSNAMRLFEPEIVASHHRWMANSFEKNRQLVIEPWLEREYDFSVQLEMTASGLELCGWTGLLNDPRGQFMANLAEPEYCRQPPARVRTLFQEQPEVVRRLPEFYAGLFRALEAELRGAHFRGPVGIDAFVYRDAAGRRRVKPVVEINPRFTMGRVLVELMRHAVPGSQGRYRLVNRVALREAGDADLAAYAERMTAQFPLILEGHTAPLIREGFVCLNDPTTAQACVATFQVGRQLGGLA